MASLNGIGLNGYRLLIAHAMDLARRLKEKLEALEFCKVLNFDTPGPQVCWWVLPRGRNAKEIFRRFENNELSDDERQQYMKEIRRLYKKREATMDPAIDARLSFSNGIGYSPNGFSLPAWKAVFFNPQTDESVVDRILASIEDVA